MFSREKNLKSNYIIIVLTLTATIIVSGCASNSPQKTVHSYPAAKPYPVVSQPGASSYGAIESMLVTQAETASTGTGAIVGGLVGGLLGNQIGGGNGKTVTTLAGVVGGAMLGKSLQKNMNAQPEMYEIRVRLDNGYSTTVIQENIYELNVGNRVRVADGRAYRY
jgi:outer membrane lipoprotein SlyB